MNKIRDSRPPKRFLKINDLTEKEVLPLRVVDSSVKCVRCDKLEIVTELGAILTNFVCKSCRQDNQEWDYAMRNGENAYSIQAMAMTMPLHQDTINQSGEGRS